MELPPELWCMVGDQITSGSDWKSFIFTCKMFADFNNTSKVDRFSNHLATLVRMFPDANWNWLTMCTNPWMCDSIIEQIANFGSIELRKETTIGELDGYNIQILTINNNKTVIDFTNVSIDLIRKYHPKKKLYGLSRTASWQVIHNNLDLRWMWDQVSVNPNITWDIISSHPELTWDYLEMIGNPNITIDIILDNFKKFLSNVRGMLDEGYEEAMLWSNISEKLHLTYEVLKMDLPWNYNSMSDNKTLPMQYVIDHPELEWDLLALAIGGRATREVFNAISGRNLTGYELGTRFDPSEVSDDSNHPFKWYNISGNPWLTSDFVKDNLQKDWNYYALSMNPALNLELASLLKDKLNWFLVSQSIWVTLELVLKHPELPWNWYGISLNQNISWQDVAKNMNRPWDWKELSRNQFKRGQCISQNGLSYYKYVVS